MSPRRIRVSSRALGEKRRLIVHVYDTVSEMRMAAHRFNDNDHGESLGVTQAYCTESGIVTVPVVRVVRGHLGTQVLSHELHHAAASIYGSTLTADALARDVLTHHNEPFAHLYSDLMCKVVDALYRFGYYGDKR